MKEYLLMLYKGTIGTYSTNPQHQQHFVRDMLGSHTLNYCPTWLPVLQVSLFSVRWVWNLHKRKRVGKCCRLAVLPLSVNGDDELCVRDLDIETKLEEIRVRGGTRKIGCLTTTRYGFRGRTNLTICLHSGGDLSLGSWL